MFVCGDLICYLHVAVLSQPYLVTVLRLVHKSAAALQVIWYVRTELAFTSYQVEISISEESWNGTAASTNSTEFTFENLTLGTIYHVRARAVNAFRMSLWTYETAVTYDGKS